MPPTKQKLLFAEESQMRIAKQTVVNMHGLKLVVLPGYGVGDDARKYYDTAYNSWKTVWKDTFLELDGSDKLFSDHFTRQDYHLTIFHGTKCVTALSFRRLNLQSPADIEDSWLKLWPKEIIQSYQATLKDGVMASWFYVAPEYRRSKTATDLTNLQVSHRLTEMISFFVLDLQAEVTFGAVRNNRSVNSLFIPSGCKVVKPKVTDHGVEVDLITWLPENVKPALQKFPQAALDLWNAREVFTAEPPRVGLPPQRRASNTKRSA